MATKSLPTLYKYTTTGKVQVWSVHVKGNTFWTEEGLKGGKITRNKPTTCVAKNVGRANETTPQEQAQLEAQSKWQKKVDKGYNTKLTGKKKYFEPMLAQKLDKYEDLCFTEPTFIQPKLDGLRCIGQDGTMKSRNGKEFSTVDHLAQNKVTLDGELYNHKYRNDFNKIVSLIKRTKPSDEDIESAEANVEFWVYDYPDHNGPFSERYDALKKFVKKHGNKKIKVVPTYRVRSQEDIEKYHAQFIEQGYEGSIIRIDLGAYENKRSKQLLKKKDFQDAEFTIIDIVEGKGNRSGTAGNLLLKTRKGVEFGAGLRGDKEFVTNLLKNKKKYIGKTATIRYGHLTPDGIPRWPVATQIAREDIE